MDGDKWLTSRLGRFLPGTEPRYPLNRGLGGHGDNLDTFIQDKYLLTPPGSELRNFSLIITSNTLFKHQISERDSNAELSCEIH